MEPRLNPRLRHTINSQCRETTCTLVDNRQQMTLGVSQCALRVTPGKQALSSLYRQPSGKPRVEGTPPGETTKKQQRDVSFTLTLTAAPASRLHAGSTYVISHPAARTQAAGETLHHRSSVNGHHSIFTRPEYSHSNGFHFTLIRQTQCDRSTRQLDQYQHHRLDHVHMNLGHQSPLCSQPSQCNLSVFHVFPVTMATNSIR